MKKLIIFFGLIFTLSGFAQSQAFIDKYLTPSGDQWSCDVTCVIITGNGWSGDEKEYILTQDGKTAGEALRLIRKTCDFHMIKLRARFNIRTYGVVTNAGKVSNGRRTRYNPLNSNHSIRDFTPTIKEDCFRNY
jgi:hypothetical protein